MYIAAGQEDKGLQILKMNNICGINSAAIGLTLARRGKGEEAREYIYQAYSDNINNTIRTMSGMLYMYGEQKNELYREVGSWLLNYLNSLVIEKEATTFIDKLKAIILAQMAVFAAFMGKYDEAESYITDACQLALIFDGAPDYSVQSIKFMQNLDMPAILLDGLGETAVSAIESYVFKNAKQGESLEFVKRKFEMLKNEGITK